MTRGRGKALAFPASAIALSIAVIGVAAGQDGSAADKVISAIDLAKPFGALVGWRFIAVQGPDEVNGLGETIPGKITLCLRPGIGAVCAPSLQSMARPPSPDYEISWRAHYLNDARVVYPRGRSAQPLLLLQTASSYSGDGDQVRYTQLLAYRREGDRFETIFARDTGRNNNQEVRFIDSGRLTGDVIVVEPTSNAPFAYWVTVNRLDPNYSYRQKLRYRSATRYGDNNPLTVIDSEMPNIQQRLGLWRPGRPMPLPAKGCSKPRLVKMELWCS